MEILLPSVSAMLAQAPVPHRVWVAVTVLPDASIPTVWLTKMVFVIHTVLSTV